MKRGLWLVGAALTLGVAGLLACGPPSDVAEESGHSERDESVRPYRDRVGAGEEAPAPDRSVEERPIDVPDVPDVGVDVDEHVAELIAQLCFDEHTAALTRLELTRLIGGGSVDRADSSRATLQVLTGDAAAAAPRLRNVAETAAFLRADFLPSPETRAKAASYLGQARESPGEAHQLLAAALDGWPPSVARSAALRSATQRLADSRQTPPALRAQLAKLLESGDPYDREAAIRGIAGLSSNNRVAPGLLHAAAETFVRIEGPAGAVESLAAVGRVAQARYGYDAPHNSIMTLGMHVSGLLEGRVRPGDWEPGSDLRTDFIAAAASLRLGVGDDGAAHFIAVSLGAAPDRDVRAMDALAKIWATAESRAVRSTAMVNLGRVGSVEDVLARLGSRVDSAPLSEEAMLTQGDYFSALHNALTRHPEEADRVAPLVNEALLAWSPDERLDLITEALLRNLVSQAVPGTEDVLRELAADESFRLRGLAKRAHAKAKGDDQ